MEFEIPENTRRVYMDISVSVDHRMKVFCAEKNITRKKFMEELVTRFLSDVRTNAKTGGALARFIQQSR